MKKINITPFNVSIRNPDGTKKDAPYDIKDSMVEILFSANLKLSSAQLIKQDKLAQKILDNKSNDLILEDEEYERLKHALDSVSGLGRNDVVFVKRILEASELQTNKA